MALQRRSQRSRKAQSQTIRVSDPLQIQDDSVFTENSLPFSVRAARGDFSNVSQVYKFGHNEDVDAAAEEDIFSVGGKWSYIDDITTRTVASVLEIVSTSTADDDASGAGANKIMVEGLDANYDVLTEEVSMSGTTPVFTTGEFIRVYRAWVSEMGLSGDFNQGNITIEHDSTTRNVAQIDQSRGQTLMACYCVPAGKTGFLTRVYGSIGAGSPAGVEVELAILTQGSGASDATLTKHLDLMTSTLPLDRGSSLESPLVVLPEKTNVSIRANSDTNNTIVTGGFHLYLVDD
jgi:hypothetical protein